MRHSMCDRVAACLWQSVVLLLFWLWFILKACLQQILVFSLKWYMIAHTHTHRGMHAHTHTLTHTHTHTRMHTHTHTHRYACMHTHTHTHTHTLTERSSVFFWSCSSVRVFISGIKIFSVSFAVVEHKGKKYSITVSVLQKGVSEKLAQSCRGCFSYFISKPKCQMTSVCVLHMWSDFITIFLKWY